MINPAPAPSGEAASDDAEAVVRPLPAGPLLYLVRLAGDSGRAEAVPIARLADGRLAELGLPDTMDADYHARFDSAFYSAGAELPLHAGGRRIGTLVLDGSTRSAAGTADDGSSCLSVATGRTLLLPTSNGPEYAFAWRGEEAAGQPVSYDVAPTDNRMRTFGPVLAENLLRAGGENRPYLAERAAMRAVPWSGDERPAMAATYLVNDRLDGAAPQNPASSLFFLARFDGRQYVTEWSEIRRYEDGEGREAFVYFGALRGPGGRIDVATRHDGATTRLVASVDRAEEERRVDWIEPAGCPAIALLSSGSAAAPGSVAAPGSAAAPGTPGSAAASPATGG